jgi:hypothetical protein
MGVPVLLKKLCPPALIYFIISIIGIVLVMFQNIGNTKSYHIGSFSMQVPNTLMVFIIKIIYVIFWTWILNLLCKGGFSVLSWLFVLFPFILMFVVVGLVMIHK